MKKYSKTACVSPQGRGADAAQLSTWIQMLFFSPSRITMGKNLLLRVEIWTSAPPAL